MRAAAHFRAATVAAAPATLRLRRSQWLRQKSVPIATSWIRVFSSRIFLHSSENTAAARMAVEREPREPVDHEIDRREETADFRAARRARWRTGKTTRPTH